MSKKGFTLIELLAVIALIAVVMTLAVPGIRKVDEIIKNNMLEKKKELIEHAAILYAEDGNVVFDANNKASVLVYKLVEAKYLDKDNSNECIKVAGETPGCVVDPSKKDSYLDMETIEVTKKNSRYSAKWVEDDES